MSDENIKPANVTQDVFESALSALSEKQDRRISELSDSIRQLRGFADWVNSTLPNTLIQDLNALRGEVLSSRTALEILRSGQRRMLAEKYGRMPAPPDLRPVREMSMDQCFEKLKELAPRAYELWRGLLEVNRLAYRDLPTHSCSVDGHSVAELFGDFARPYLNGAVLDVGCGPQPMPVYLQGYPPSQIAGIDPLAPSESGHRFIFTQGVSEFLPWADGAFGGVIVATSLDHVLLLDLTLREIKRVLSRDGFLLLWVGFSEGAKAYDPYAVDIRPVDEFHLFHFDRPWFEKLLEDEGFLVDSSVAVEGQCSRFYALSVLR